MQGMQQWLMKLGVRTFTDTYFTLLNGNSPVKRGQDMPKPVGWIYGIAFETDSVQPTDATKPTITIAQASLLYLYFKVGTNLFMNNFRIDRAVYYSPTTSLPFGIDRYFPVNIPEVTDLKESYYNNPTGIGNGTTGGPPVYIPLTIYYIDIDSYKELLAKGYLFDGAKALPHHPVHSPTKGTANVKK